LAWWLNQSAARRHELDAGYLWSAADSVQTVQAGELVYVHAGGRIGVLGMVTGAPFAAHAPAAAGGRGARPRARGWRVPAHFEELLQPLRPKGHLAALRRVMSARHAPLGATGEANARVPLARLSPQFEALLRALLGGQVEEFERLAPSLGSAERADEAAEQVLRARAGLDAGSRRRLLMARRGQGVYREHVERYEQCCRLSGLLDRRHLRARHIKPWRDANDREKLDGYNGLLLSPHFDQLFERGLISFADDGELLIARSLNPAVLAAWGLALPRNVGVFLPGQRSYLAYHRQYVFERQAAGRRAPDA
jgi:hypothetical protein